MSFMLSVTIKPYMLSDIILSDVMLTVVMIRVLYVLYVECHNKAMHAAQGYCNKCCYADCCYDDSRIRPLC
jgi:hypothetical protein